MVQHRLPLPFAPPKVVAASSAREGPQGTGSSGKDLEGWKILLTSNGDQSFTVNVSDAEQPRRPLGQQLSPGAANVPSTDKREALLTVNSAVFPSAPKTTVDKTVPALSSSSSEKLDDRPEAPKKLSSLHVFSTNLAVGAPDSARRFKPAAFDTGVDGPQKTRLLHLSHELNRIAAEFTQGKVGEESLSKESPSLDAKQGVFGKDRTPPLARDSKEFGVAKTVRGVSTGDSTNHQDADSKLSEPPAERNSSSETADKWNAVVGRKAALAEGGDLYCSVGPAYTGPLPPSLCSYYLVQNSVQYHSPNKTLHVASSGSWHTLAKGGSGAEGATPVPGPPRVLLTMAAPEVKSVVGDFPLPVQFVTRVRSLLEEGNLAGLAFDLSLAADDFSSYSMLLKVTREYLSKYHFVGIIDFAAASKLGQRNLAELVRSADKVFLHNDPRHVHISATSVPNPFTSPDEHVYSVENAVKLAGSLRLASPAANNVCPTLSLAVFKFETSDRGVDKSPPALGTLATEVDVTYPYSKLCKVYRGHHTHYDEETLSTYAHSRNSWVGFDDDASMEKKMEKLTRHHHVGCFLVENVDLDDPTNDCKTGDFRRLRLIKRALERGENTSLWT
ncbi:uncharacterized protein LOC144153318 [Haemaphysalis longicornis]